MSTSLSQPDALGNQGIPGNLDVGGNLRVAGTIATPSGGLGVLAFLNVATASVGGTGFTSYTVGDMLYADTTTTLAKLVDVVAGSFLRSGGVATAPVWSTTTYPNSSVVGDLLYTSATSVYSNLTAVATGSVLISKGVTTAPAWSNTLILSGTTASTSTTTGALVVGGGAGFAGAVNMGDSLYVGRNPGNVNFRAFTGQHTSNGNNSSVEIALLNGGNASLVITQNGNFGGSNNGGVVFNASLGNGTNIIDFQLTNAVKFSILTTGILSSATTEATSGAAGAIISLGGIYATKKIITATTVQALGGYLGGSGGVGLTQTSTATLGRSITIENGLITAFA